MENVQTSEGVEMIPINPVADGIKVLGAIAGGALLSKTLFGKKDDHDEKGVHMNLFDAQENMAEKKEQLKKVAEAWAKDHPEQNSSARAELIKMLSERPRDAADFGDLRIKYGIPKPIGFWIALHNDVARLGHAPANEKRMMYYLASLENDAGYWGRISESDAQPAKSKLPSAEAKESAHSFCISDEGRKIADWLKRDLKEKGPINWTVFGWAHFLPVGVSVGTWLNDSTMDFVNAVSKGGGRDYCELRELSPDSRPVRTKPDTLPGWMIKDYKPVQEIEQSEDEDVSFVASRPFFVGEVHFRKSQIGFTGQYVVSDAMSATEGPVSDIPIAKVAKNTLVEGEFVVGLNSAKGPFIFFNQQWNSAVQVLMWDSFKESSTAPSAEDYFSKHPTGVLSANFTTILGNGNRPGYVVIADQAGVYLKGFSSIGNGVVRYFNVEKYTGDFLQISSANQVTELKYRGNAFAILVPEQGNPYAAEHKHAVLDCDGWQVLPHVEEEKNVTDSGDELVPVVQPLKSGRTEEAERSSIAKEPTEMFSRICCSEKEELFLKEFLSDVKNNCGYEYKPQDIIRFHTSMKCGSFTLLGGAPGCGKSTLVSLYAMSLLGSRQPNLEKIQYLTIDVNPAWIEPGDLLGYWDLNGKYSCATSGLVPFLRDSSKANQVRIVCMEEMNLARVEHYFANFIQAMSRELEQRVLVGIPSESDGHREGALLPIPGNIRFVGTNNFDETTQRFSSRFYDRCNYIELQQDSLDVEFPKIIPSPGHGQFNYGIAFDEYNNWLAHDVRADRIDKSVHAKFKSIVDKLIPLNLQPSPRVRQAILEYILCRPFFDGCGSKYASEADCQLIALDEAMAQRVLPKYSINYLRDEIEVRKRLLAELEGMPLSHALFTSKCNSGERPSRV